MSVWKKPLWSQTFRLSDVRRTQSIETEEAQSPHSKVAVTLTADWFKVVWRKWRRCWLVGKGTGQSHWEKPVNGQRRLRQLASPESVTQLPQTWESISRHHSFMDPLGKKKLQSESFQTCFLVWQRLFWWRPFNKKWMSPFTSNPNKYCSDLLFVSSPVFSEITWSCGSSRECKLSTSLERQLI